MIEGEGAGKGDTYRKVDREKFCQNFDEIDWSPEGTITVCECFAEKVKVGPEWLCFNPECPYLNGYHKLVLGYDYASDTRGPGKHLDCIGTTGCKACVETQQ